MREKLKTKAIAVLVCAVVLALSGCSAFKEGDGTAESSKVPVDKPGVVTISFPFVLQSGTSTNQYAVWVEDSFGNYVKTIFVTDYTALYGHETREDSIPEWVDKSGIRDGTGENFDAVSGATPKTGIEEYVWTCDDEKGAIVPVGEYRIIVEGTVKEESRVVYTVDITVGNRAMTVEGVPEYYEITGNSDMIGTVTVEYVPN